MKHVSKCRKFRHTAVNATLNNMSTRAIFGTEEYRVVITLTPPDDRTTRPPLSSCLCMCSARSKSLSLSAQ